jgi:phage gpG-like protein
VLTITVDSKPVSDMLEKLSRRMSNLQPAMHDIGVAMETRVSGRFETRTDPLGKAWAPWAESTRENYPADGLGLLLQRYPSGMLSSLNSKSDSTSVRIGFGAVASKSGDVYATYHEFGTETMPRRGLLFADPDAGTISPDDERTVLDVIEGFLTGGI